MRSHLIGLALVGVIAATACGDQAGVRATGGPGTSSEVSGGTWRAMSASPLSARHSSVALPLGSRVFFLGGQDDPLCPPNADCAIAPKRLRDGAVYDVTTDSWRRLAPAPEGLSLGAETGVIGQVVYVLSPPADGQGAGTFLSYDTALDRWSTLPPPPVSGTRLVAAGQRLLAYQATHEQGTPRPDQLYDVAARSWSALPMDPLVPSFDRSMVWTGERLVLFAPRLVPQPGGADGPSWVRAARLDPTAKAWQTMPDSNQVISGYLTPVWSRGRVLVPAPGGTDGGETNNYGRVLPFGGWFDVESGRWSPLPEVADADERYRSWGVSATSPEYSADGSLVLDVERERWIRLAPPPSQVDTGQSAAWAAQQLVVWGGGHADLDAEKSTLVAGGAVWTPPA